MDKELNKLVDNLTPAQVTNIIKKRIEKNTESVDSVCPYCSSNNIEFDVDLKKDFNILIQSCEDCGNEWCKEQSVKIPSVLVRQIALAMRLDKSYTGLSEFVRASVREKCHIINNSQEAVGKRNMDYLIQMAYLSDIGDEDYEEEEEI